MHVCTYACMYACMHACMHVCMYACMHVQALDVCRRFHEAGVALDAGLLTIVFRLALAAGNLPVARELVCALRFPCLSRYQAYVSQEGLGSEPLAGLGLSVEVEGGAWTPALWRVVVHGFGRARLVDDLHFLWEGLLERGKAEGAGGAHTRKNMAAFLDGFIDACLEAKDPDAALQAHTDFAAECLPGRDGGQGAGAALSASTYLKLMHCQAKSEVRAHCMRCWWH